MDDQTKIAPLQSDQKEESVVVTSEPDSDPSDKLTPEHPRFKEVYSDLKAYKQENGELKGKMAELEEKLEKLSENYNERVSQDGADITSDEEEALERIEKALKSRSSFVTKDELDAERRGLILQRLEDKWNGTNGYPKFDGLDVVTYARKNGFGDNYEKAYRDMHYDAFVQIEAKKIAKSQEIPTSESPTAGDRSSVLGDVTPEKIKDMSLQEWYEKGDKIKQALKDSLK